MKDSSIRKACIKVFGPQKGLSTSLDGPGIWNTKDRINQIKEYLVFALEIIVLSLGAICFAIFIFKQLT